MPWNEPGDNDKNPWGNKGKKSSGGSKGNGTADIEDITRKMNEKLGGLFGNKNSSDGNGGPSGTSLALVGIVLLGAWLATGFYQVDSAQRGVEFRFGAFQKTTLPGLHWHIPYPVDSVELVDVDKVRRAEDRTNMLTSDENIVDIGVAAQYRIDDVEKYLFNLYLPDYKKNPSIGTLHQVMRSAVREIAGRNTMDSIITENRATLAPDIRKVMQKILNKYNSGLEVIKVNVTNAEAPQQVKDAFDDANRAREDKNRYKNQAETYAKKVVPVAEGKASRLSEAAIAYKSRIVSRAEGDASRFSQLVAEYEKAPNVTRKRLYLETMEEVYENTRKIIVDSKSGNNLLYLPLNQMQNQGASNASAESFDPAIAGSVNQIRRNQNSRRDGVRNATRVGR